MFEADNKDKKEKKKIVLGRLSVFLFCTSFLSFSSLFFCGSLLASQDNDFQQYADFGRHISGSVADTAHQFKPEQTLPNYNPSPKQQDYYHGVTQQGSTMEQDAASAVDSDSTGSAVKTAFISRPKYIVNPASEEIAKGQFIQGDAYNISHGISDKYVDCTKKETNCRIDYSYHQCTIPHAEQHLTCTKNLDPVVTHPGREDKVYTVDVNGNSYHCSGYTWLFRTCHLTLTANFSTGQIQATDGDKVSLAVNPLMNPTGYSKINVDVLSVTSPNETTVRVTQFPSEKNHYTSSFVLTGGSLFHFSAGAHMIAQIKFKMTGDPSPVVTDTWQDNCLSMEKMADQGSVDLVHDVCTKGVETRQIDGVPVSRDCWQKSYTYQISNPTHQVDECKPYLDKGCSQINSQCTNKIGDMCLTYQNTYQCVESKTCDGSGVVCGDNFYCMSGDCTVHNNTENKNFDQAVSGMAAIGAAGKSVADNHGVSAFGGQPQECRDYWSGFNDCCRDDGWGQDIHLAHCSDAEKQLGKNKENQLTVYVGRYCDKEVAGICLKHKKTYCVFGSKLAELVQDQGRRSQLGIDFGSAESPNCRGLTPDELSKINFSQIDFSSVVDDIKNNLNFPDEQAVKEAIAKKLHGEGSRLMDEKDEKDEK